MPRPDLVIVEPVCRKRRALIGAAGACLSGPFAAVPALGRVHDFPATVAITPGGPRLHRGGVGRFRFFFVPYYACALYALAELKEPAAVLAADAPRRFAMQALRNISAFEFLWGLDQGLADNSTPAELKAVAADLDRVRGLMRAAGGLDRGMRGSLDYLPGIGVRLLVNDAPQGPALGGKALADALFRVWLGDRPLDASLKEVLFAG